MTVEVFTVLLVTVEVVTVEVMTVEVVTVEVVTVEVMTVDVVTVELVTVLCITLSSVLGHPAMCFLHVCNSVSPMYNKRQYIVNCLPHMTHSVRSPAEHLETGTIAKG